jgi:hypothetical protein
MKRLLFLIPLMWIITVQAQTQINIGSKELRSDLISSSHNFFKVYDTDSVGNIVDEFINEQVITVDKAHGTITFARSRQVPVGSFMEDTSVTDLAFKPVHMHEMHNKQQVYYVMNFWDTVATVNKFKNGQGVSTTAFPLKPGYVEDNMIEYLYPYLDLQKGTVYNLTNFNKDVPNGFSNVTVEYAFDDIYMVGTHPVICRVLRYVNGRYWGYVWIDKDNRSVIREIGSDKLSGLIYSVTKV